MPTKKEKEMAKQLKKAEKKKQKLEEKQRKNGRLPPKPEVRHVVGQPPPSGADMVQMRAPRPNSLPLDPPKRPTSSNSQRSLESSRSAGSQMVYPNNGPGYVPLTVPQGYQGYAPPAPNQQGFNGQPPWQYPFSAYPQGVNGPQPQVPQQYQQGGNGQPPFQYQRVNGQAPLQYGQNPQQYQQGANGQPPMMYRQGANGQNPQHYPQGANVQNPQQYQHGVNGQPPVQYQQGFNGQNPQQYHQGVNGQQPMTYQQGVNGQPGPLQNQQVVNGQVPAQYQKGVNGQVPAQYQKGVNGQPPLQNQQVVNGQVPAQYQKGVNGQVPPQNHQGVTGQAQPPNRQGPDGMPLDQYGHVVNQGQGDSYYLPDADYDANTLQYVRGRFRPPLPAAKGQANPPPKGPNPEPPRRSSAVYPAGRPNSGGMSTVFSTQLNSELRNKIQEKRQEIPEDDDWQFGTGKDPVHPDLKTHQTMIHARQVANILSQEMSQMKSHDQQQVAYRDPNVY